MNMLFFLKLNRGNWDARLIIIKRYQVDFMNFCVPKNTYLPPFDKFSRIKLSSGYKLKFI
ncbi:hypothetical protein EGI22_06635 [Lacihabitans sp. LS3-19]|nr:hypothetical protein [Lacihabitans sp. LS3-19]